jgi:hemolysin III
MPQTEGVSVSIGVQAKPRWRGRLHEIAFFCSIPSGVTLVAAGAGALSRIAATIYALSLSGLYGVSASYHRIKWSPRGLARMQRLDHSMIYVLIAGSYTPICLLLIQSMWAYIVLGVVWAGALAGVVMKVFGMERTRAVSGAMYIVLGWAALLASPVLIPKMSIPVLVLIAAGGVLYTLGAIVLLRRRPDPSPLVFGYHEVWHVMVVAAGACHYAAILMLVLASS